jgi:hypothetical protein
MIFAPRKNLFSQQFQRKTTLNLVAPQTIESTFMQPGLVKKAGR